MNLNSPPLITIVVEGVPGPQGSKKARPVWKGRGASKVFTGRIAMEESSKKVGPWREAVEDAAKLAAGPDWVTLDEAVIAQFVFSLPRGRTVKRELPTTYPDLSKIIRSTEDALTTARIWRDDSLVIGYYKPRKLYAGDLFRAALPVPGCLIRIWSATAVTL